MKHPKFMFCALIGTVLICGPERALASGYGSCETEVTVICSHGIMDGGNGVAVKLEFEVSGEPDCRGLAKVEMGQKFEASVALQEGMDPGKIDPGSRLRLKYDYFEGLTPDGFETTEIWSLVSEDGAL